MVDKKELIWKSADLRRALDVDVSSDIETGRLQFNSKDVVPGDLFIALEGDKGDGHDYVQDALNAGAAAAIVSKEVDVPAAMYERLIKVPDTIAGLRRLAEYKRMHLKAKIIAVTGSMGKTTTKDALHLMLSEFGKSFASRANFNNHIGVPINLASMPADIDYAVIELGMSAPGEISALTNQLLPHFAIITNIAPVHLEFFDSVAGIARAKCEIFEGLDLNDGVAIFPIDTQCHDICVRTVDQLCLQNVREVGRGGEVEFVAYEHIEDNKIRLTYRIYKEEIEFVMDFIPEYIAANFAACFAVCHDLGLDLERAALALARFQLGVGRGRIIQVASKGRNYCLIADYYNANPVSMKAALENLAQMSDSDKVVVMGDMGELGKNEQRFHEDMAFYVNNSGAKKVFLVGRLMPTIAGYISKDIEVATYSKAEDLAVDIEKRLAGGETVLIKGSRSVQLEKVAEAMGFVDISTK